MNFLHESPEGFPKLLFSKEPFEFKEITNNINTSHDLVFRSNSINTKDTLENQDDDRLEHGVGHLQ